ncbi:MAG: FAD-dependent oxidoreductase [Clostridia bacterium]|nr:FAD-dependent oxidoreductase [Clostridia bacterium]
MRITSEQIKEIAYDLVVVGGGMTGLCAAIEAARNGAKTALVHERPVLGGNASSEVRMHICGASASMVKPHLSESGIVHELMLANKRLNDSYNFSIWDAVLFDAAKREKNLTVYLNTTMIDAYSKKGVVNNVECYQMTTEKRFFLSARYFADCTGNGTLCSFAGAKFRMGREAKSEFNEPHAPEKATTERMGNTLLFKAVDKGVPVEFVPPVEIIKFTEEQLKYRKHCAAAPKELAQSISEDEFERLFGGYCPDYGYWWIEIPGESDNIIEEYEDIRDLLVKAVYGVWDHIKNGGDHGAENYELSWVGMLPGTRESRRIECDYMLNETDILEGRTFEDKVAYGGWPIDDNRFGLFAFDHIPSETFAFPECYDIPYRSYCVKDFKNLFVGGRCMGVTRLGMASTRVMGTCAIGGQAIGAAAAILTRNSCSDVRDVDIKKLQQTLIKDDCYLRDVFNEDTADFALNSTVTTSSEQEGYSGSNLVNGITRSINGASNQWRSMAGADCPQWIKFDLNKSARVELIQITFDSNFNIEKKITLSSRRQKEQVIGIPKELVRDYEVALFKEGKMVASKEIRGNYQRVNKIAFEPTLCDGVKITVNSTNGEKCVRIFEVRIYEEKE